MSNHLLKAYNDDSGSSGKPSHSHQSCWMSPSTQLPCKQGSLIAPHSQTFCKEEGLHHKQKRLHASLNISSDIPGCKREQNFRKETLSNEPFCSYEANSQSARKRNRSSMLVLATNKNMKSSEGDAEDPSNKAVVVSTHFSNNDNDFTGKYEKYSAVLVHERNGFSAILSRNQNDFPLFSQTETRSFLITKRTGVHDLSKGDQIVHESTQNGGVKIQPLWSSTDSEKDNLGDVPTPKGDRSCDLSGETDTMDVVAVSNKNDVSGLLSSPSVKRTMRDETLHSASVDPQEDKARGKFPVIEMHDTGSMDGMEPTTSRTQSLEVEHLQEPSSRHNKDCTLQEPSSSLWVKRLKPSSSEVGESSSHDKTHMLLNKSSSGKKLLISDESMMGHTMNNGQSLSRKSKDRIFQCSWIQRWCQDHTVAKRWKIRSKGGVICEPDSSKLAFDEAEKKQFPSIAAMALMGKSMNGFRPCKLTKHGPLVVWNTDN